MHACELARALLIPRVLVPLHPGALSAIGILRSDVVQDTSLTEVIPSTEAKLMPRIEERFKKLSDEIFQKMSRQGFSKEEVEIEQSVDLRYLGQSFEINTPYSNKVLAD